MCLNVLVGLEDGGVFVCVCWKKTHFVTGCVHSWDLRPIRCSDWHQISFGAAVDAAVNPQYLELLTTRTEAQRARLMFEKRCVQERWEVSEDGGTLCFHQQTSVGCIFRAWVRSSPDVVCVRIISGLFVVRYKLCDLWSHRPLKPAAALTEASDKKKKLVTLDFSSSVYSVHSPTSTASISQSNVWNQFTLQDWTQMTESSTLCSDLPSSGLFSDERLLPRLSAAGWRGR